MYCVGLTGNIASGKSTVSQLFKERAVVIISADEAARALTTAKQPAFLAIKKHFGPSVINAQGELDRPALRQRIFNKPEQRLWLEQLLHPLIRQFMQFKLRESTGPYAILEIPLLKKRSDYPYLDRILVVLASHEQQIKRLRARDHSSKAQAEAILAVQDDEASRRKLADDLIRNEGDLAELAKKVENLHHQYLQLASQKP